MLAMDGKESAPVRLRIEGEPGVSLGQMVNPVGLVLNQISRNGDAVSWWTAELSGIEPRRAFPGLSACGVLHGGLAIGTVVRGTRVPLADAAAAYDRFGAGAVHRFVLIP